MERTPKMSQRYCSACRGRVLVMGPAFKYVVREKCSTTDGGNTMVFPSIRADW
jgi:hypothetical protein